MTKVKLYVHLAFHDAQAVKFIPWAVIGCHLRSGYAGMHIYVSVAFFPSLKQNFIAYHSSKESSRPDCIFEIHKLWQSGFSRVYSNCCCNCLFEPEIIKIDQSSHKMYSNNILNFQESTTILNACTKKSGNLLKALIYLIYMYNKDLALGNLQGLIGHKTKPNQVFYIWYIYI